MKTPPDDSRLGLCVSAVFVALGRSIDQFLDKEIRMTTSDQVGEKRKFTTSPRVQAWFLKRSRDLWKTKYAELKADAKRLGNRVRDVGRSRDKRTEENKALKKRVAELEAEKTALHEQMAALKKDGLLGAVGFAL